MNTLFLTMPVRVCVHAMFLASVWRPAGKSILVELSNSYQVAQIEHKCTEMFKC